MELTSLNTLTADGLNTLLEPGGSFNTILGSGISRWGPNPRRADSRGEIPTGQDISKAIVHTLFSVPPTPNAEDMDTVKRLLKEFPFEAIFDCCPDINKAENLARTLCSGAVANPVHHAFASLASAGVVKSIVTTNYDMGLDDALQYFGNPIVKIVDPPVIIPVRAYFKIHGSVDSDSPLVINLRREGMMSLPKRRVLQSLLNGVPLLVLGYSGLDFEVCPEIASARPKRVVWNFFSEEDVHLSPGLKRLEDAGMEIHILVGDMRRILQLLGYPVELNDVSSRVSEVCSLLEENFSPNERLTWRVTVLNFIGYARLARVALTSLIEPTRVDLARCFFHEGRYRKSTKEYLKASRLASDDRLRRLALVEAADAARCIGKRRRAENLIASALENLDSSVSHHGEIRGRCLLKRILIQRERYLIARKLGRIKHADKLKEQALPWFSEAAALTLAVGDIPEWQQLRYWAERMSVPADVLRPPDSYGPPPTLRGYRHLGYRLALNMEFTDIARTRSVSLQELEEHMKEAEDFGSHPQCWKLCHAVIRLFPGQLWHWLPRMIFHFSRCQYTLTRRLMGLAGGT